MIDLETMSVSSNAAIVSIGACAFNLYDQAEPITQTFEVNISLESNEQAGRHISASTVMWWMQQSKDAQKALYESECCTLEVGLNRLQTWISSVKPSITHVWANDPDFDIVILKNAFDQCGRIWPFHFAANRSMRTIFELAYPEIDKLKEVREFFRSQGTHHRAVDDAVAQAHIVRHCYGHLIHNLPPLIKD